MLKERFGIYNSLDLCHLFILECWLVTIIMFHDLDLCFLTGVVYGVYCHFLLVYNELLFL